MGEQTEGRGAEQTAVVCQGLGYDRVIVGGHMGRQVKCNSSKDLDFAAR